MGTSSIHDDLYEAVMQYFSSRANAQDLEDALYVWADQYEWELVDRERQS